MVRDGQSFTIVKKKPVIGSTEESRANAADEIEQQKDSDKDEKSGFWENMARGFGVTNGDMTMEKLLDECPGGGHLCSVTI